MPTPRGGRGLPGVPMLPAMLGATAGAGAAVGGTFQGGGLGGVAYRPGRRTLPEFFPPGASRGRCTEVCYDFASMNGRGRACFCRERSAAETRPAGAAPRGGITVLKAWGRVPADLPPVAPGELAGMTRRERAEARCARAETKRAKRCEHECLTHQNSRVCEEECRNRLRRNCVTTLTNA